MMPTHNIGKSADSAALQACRLNMGLSMPAYAVLEPPRRNRSDSELADRFVFLRERFGWGAFLLGPLWMIWRQLWRMLIIYLVLRGFGVWAVADRRLFRGLVRHRAAVDLLIGSRPTDLRRWTLIRRGWHDRGTVIADDLAMAEWRFFSTRHLRRRRPLTPPPGVAWRSRSPGAAGERRHHRSGIRQPATGRQGVRACGARQRLIPMHSLPTIRRRCARPSGWYCRGLAPSRIAGAASIRCPAWSRL